MKIASLNNLPLSMDLDTVEDQSVFAKDQVSSKGGKGSGNWGHAGRPGEVGGSQPGKGGGYLPPNENNIWLSSVFFATGVIGTNDTEYNQIASLSQSGKKKELYERINKLFDPETALDISSELRSQIKDEIVTSLSEKTGIDYKIVNRIIAAWRNERTSYDISALQKCAEEEFGLEKTEHLRRSMDLAFASENDIRFLTRDVVAAFEKFDKGDRLTIDSYELLRNNMVDWEVPYEIQSRANEMQSEASALEREAYSILAEYTGIEFKKYYDARKNAEAEDNIKSVELAIDAWKKEDSEAQFYTGLRTSKRNPEIKKDDIKKIMRSMYERTQSDFRKAGFDPKEKITLYRGTEHPKAELKKRIPITSWTTFKSVAEFYASYVGSGDVISENVEIGNILCASLTGFGSLPLGEVLVMNK